MRKQLIFIVILAAMVFGFYLFGVFASKKETENKYKLLEKQTSDFQKYTQSK